LAGDVKRGEIWLYTFPPPDKRRPVLVLSRQSVIDLLGTVMVAPITSKIRGAPGEVIVGTAEGLKHDSAINLDHVQTVDKSRLRKLVGAVSSETMRRVGHALAVATGCSDGSGARW